MGGKSPRRHRWSAADVHGAAMSEFGHGRGERHGRYEVCSVQEMHKVVEILLNIVKATTNLKK